jgi:hypothetical protein
MRILLAVLLLVATALSDSPTEMKVRNGVIYNDAALEDSTKPPDELLTHRVSAGMTFEVKLDTVGLTYQWWLYLTQTTPEYVRRFRVCKIEMVEERR